MRRLFKTPCALLTILGTAPFVFGQGSDASQQPAPGLVSATGEVSVVRAPNLMRLQLTMMAKGSVLKDAIAMIKERSAAARTQIAGFGAAKESIKIGPPRISEAQNNARQQMEMMMAMRMRQRGKKKMKEVAMPVVVTSELTAEWPLSGQSADELLLFSRDLADKIKAADLSGAKQAQKLKPEEEELLEESESNASSRYNSGEEKPGEAVFLFVSTISDEAQNKAIAEAFQKAKGEAARLAAAAGAGLGKLRALQRPTGVGIDGSDGSEYGAAYVRAMYMARMRGTPSKNPLEAVGPQPDEVTHKVQVTASFELVTR
jgi:uncharacterized protein YggE